MPMAVISTARLVAFLSGRYAKPSITTPRTVQTIMDKSSATTGGRFQYCSAQNAI